MTEKILLDTFHPRQYQLNLCSAVEKHHYKKLLVLHPRRAGKDLVSFNLMLRQALRYKGNYYYCLPTFRQARLVIWESITNDGKKFLDFIPKELISKTNQSEMTIELINGSIIRLIGSDSYDTSLVGTNPRMVVFSEFALSDERAYKFIRPIMNANGGIVLCISTSRGRNFMYDLYQIAKESDDWYTELLTVEDTKHISLEAIQKEIDSGEMSEELSRQEYWNSFLSSTEGSIYGAYIDRMRLNGQITYVPAEINYKVNTAWDIGVADKTAIIFWQLVGNAIRIVDYYEGSDTGVEFYASLLKSKSDNNNWIYGKHIGPHDLRVREWGGGAVTRLDKARQLGINFTLAPNLSKEDGIEAVRTIFPRTMIDSKRCSLLIKALELYSREINRTTGLIGLIPKKHRWSHAVDSLKYLAVSLSLVKEGLTAEDIQKIYREQAFGSASKLPRALR